MKSYIPAQVYLYDYKSLFVRASVTIAIGIIVYSALFGIIGKVQTSVIADSQISWSRAFRARASPRPSVRFAA